MEIPEMEMPTTASEAEHTGERETGRLEAFSDGVFAIAITLLVLNLRIPTAGDLRQPDGTYVTLLSKVMGEGSSFVAYVVSFLTILVMWLNHHGQFALIRRIDRTFLVLNGLLLLLVCFVDFPTALVAEFNVGNDGRFAAILLNATYIGIAIVFNLLWNYAARKRRLLDEHVSDEIVQQLTNQYRFGPLLYVAALLLAFVNVYLSLAMNAALAIFFAFTARTERRAPHRKMGTL